MMKIRNPQFSDANETGINCEVQAGGRWVPFHARPDDVEPHGREIFAAALAMAPGAYVAPDPVPVDLSPAQFEYLLALTGFGEVWDAIAGQAKGAGDTATYAALTAERRRGRFVLAVVLDVAARFRAAAAQIAPDVDLSDAAIRAAWDEAAQYGGLSNG